MIKKHTVSFKNAAEGVKWAFSTQPNFKFHLLLSAVALFCAYYFKITSAELIVIILTVAVGLSIEMINTAIEEATDAIDSNWRQDIKLAKDVAAGAMLVYAVGAFTIACLIFGPRILALL